MEVSPRQTPAAWSDAVFHFVGAVVTSVFLIAVLYEISKLIRIYLLPRMGRRKDLVAMYGKWAVITGGSDGIGKCCAMELAKRGMNICVISNFENDIVHSIKNKYDVEVKWIDVDFSTTEVYGKIEKELSQLDDIGILMNNVGMVNQGPQPLAETDTKYLMKILNVNLTSVMLMTELVLKKMVQRDRGLIVNVSSMAARIPLPYFAMYSSTKSFVEDYSTCLSTELSGAKSNVRVKCLEPAFVRTQLLKGLSAATQFLDDTPMLRSTFRDAPEFAASVVATFGIDTPVIYAGHWSHEILTFVCPYSIGKPAIAVLFRHGLIEKIGDQPRTNMQEHDLLVISETEFTAQVKLDPSAQSPGYKRKTRGRKHNSQ